MKQSVKYLFYSFKEARKKNVANEFVFFLQLKAICPQGFIENRKFIKYVSSQLPYSEGQVSNLFKELIRLKWIDVWKRKTGEVYRYRIISLKRLYIHLGFRFKKNQAQHYKFEFIDIAGKKKNEIKAIIQSLEIKRNLKDQKYKELRKIQARIDYHLIRLLKEKEEVKKEKRKAVLTKLEKDKQEILPSFRPEDESILSGQISIKRTAFLMGFRSSTTVVKLINIAERTNLFSVKREKNIIDTDISKISWWSNPEKYKNTYWLYGKVIKNHCNFYQFDNIQNTEPQLITNTLI